MNYQTRANAYRENSVLSMSQEELVPLMYQHLLVGLKRAHKQIEERDFEAKAASVEKASGIIYELLSSLDFDEGGEIASRLASLYGYFLKELTEASRTLEASRLEPLIDMVSSLHEAWIEAVQPPEPQAEEAQGNGARPRERWE
jgi:flagellar protein FliS